MFLSAKVRRFLLPHNTDLEVFSSHTYGIQTKKEGALLIEVAPVSTVLYCY